MSLPLVGARGDLTIGNFSPPRMGTPELTEFRELRLGCGQVLTSEEDAGVFPSPQTLSDPSPHQGYPPDVRDLLSQAKVSHHCRVTVFIPLYQAVLGFPKKTSWLRRRDQPATEFPTTPPYYYRVPCPLPLGEIMLLG